MNNTIQVIIYMITFIVVLMLYRKSKEEEPLLLLKLIGFTILGAFMLDLDGFKLPLGFAIFLLFFRKINVNADMKHIAAYVGLVIFMLGVCIPQIENMIYERIHHVELLETNFYSGSLVEELDHLRDELNIDGYRIELRGLEMTIQQDGTFESLALGLAELTHEGTVNYTINLSNDRKTLEVTRYKVEDEDYLNDYIFTDAELVLANFDLITDAMLDFEGDDYYQLRTDGQRIVYEGKGNKNFQINTAGKIKVENSQLPVQAIVVDVCGGKELDELRNPFKCSRNEQFLLDLLKHDEELNESSVLDVARQRSSEIEEWLTEHTGESIGYEKNGEFVLIKDGVKEKVQESEYVAILKETPRTTILHIERENIWDVTVENPYGDAPHTMVFRLNGETREILDLNFR
ncbi:hypothetical protein [Bacillus pinisoli]|uniref:hypothetical protein n=1 Tax=Bacillus pinisoli TaxID=2901866 RepID=UPI001FF457F1|nr:hypothetical protein [Bacillus pinisoli]